ncbi:HD-GYP domain-containing protein [Paenibacillus cellulositrophicus]|uniref:HD-GYP domain-containing protein n=1 Tax=Paenibacillus cellulositrophicus TaxID=562959 RepID=UPI00203FA374|nr:HD-GYP domain-containing protein [Paenibacillus cellulositrophicus]MCM3001151.1 HD-GYP domain-containing protein [Paenibacillus cellulositrophicus]
MASVSITEIKPGLKLSKDVHTPLGGLLLQKGTVLLPRDLEILRAFMVQSVDVDNGEQETKSSVDSRAAIPQRSALSVQAGKDSVATVQRSSFLEEYDRMIQMVKSTYPSVIAAEIPIFELRGQLEALISQIKDYNLLTFSPRSMSEYDYIYHHAVLCALSSYQLAKWIGLQQKDWMQAAFAGLFHDIGNFKIDPAVLYKPQPLTAEEVEEMKRHTTYGYQLLKNVTAINEGVRLAALQHHEKVDGTGYPLRLDGGKIHIYAKIVGIVDIFHAMTLNRVYQKAQSPYLVLEQIHAEAFGKLDPGIVSTLISKVTEFHNGTVVRLSNDQIGEIVFTDRNHPTRPMVSVNGQIINLIQQRQLCINEIISS